VVHPHATPTETGSRIVNIAGKPFNNLYEPNEDAVEYRILLLSGEYIFNPDLDIARSQFFIFPMACRGGLYLASILN
jgi:hypothetical protein